MEWSSLCLLCWGKVPNKVVEAKVTHRTEWARVREHSNTLRSGVGGRFNNLKREFMFKQTHCGQGYNFMITISKHETKKYHEPNVCMYVCMYVYCEVHEWGEGSQCLVLNSGDVLTPYK
jgi:hypothetical protein